MDEFAALGKMDVIETAAGLMAGYGVKLWPILQDLSQLKRHYPQSWETFLGNAGLHQFFGNTDLTTLEHVSKRLGKTAVLARSPKARTSGRARKGRGFRSRPMSPICSGPTRWRTGSPVTGARKSPCCRDNTRGRCGAWPITRTRFSWASAIGPRPCRRRNRRPSKRCAPSRNRPPSPPSRAACWACCSARREDDGVFEHIQRLRFYLYITLIGLPPALGCLWVLLARFGLVPPVPGLLWWGANAVAPWWLLVTGSIPLLQAGLHYGAHRLSRQTTRTEEMDGYRLPLPSMQRHRAWLGGGAVLLAAAILWPRYLPEGVLLWESTAVQNLLVADTARWEDGKFVTDRADHLVYTCIYLSLYGLVTETHALRPSFPHPCAYFYRRSP
jgi:hypothetical protein